MKKVALILLTIACFTACSENDLSSDASFTLIDLPIDSFTVPNRFTFGEQATIVVNYTLPNGCYSFDSLFYEQQNTKRVIAIRAFLDLDAACTEVLRVEKHEFTIQIDQKEDYLFKFFKGQNDDGENIFEEVTVPVN